MQTSVLMHLQGVERVLLHVIYGAIVVPCENCLLSRLLLVYLKWNGRGQAALTSMVADMMAASVYIIGGC